MKKLTALCIAFAVQFAGLLLAQTTPINNPKLQGTGTVTGSLTWQAGSTAAFNGTFGGTPTGGTLDLSAVTVLGLNVGGFNTANIVGGGSPILSSSTSGVILFGAGTGLSITNNATTITYSLTSSSLTLGNTTVSLGGTATSITGIVGLGGQSGGNFTISDSGGTSYLRFTNATGNVDIVSPATVNLTGSASSLAVGATVAATGNLSATGNITASSGQVLIDGLSSRRIRLSTEANGSGMSGIWFNDAGSPASTNAAITGSATNTIINNPVQLLFTINGSSSTGMVINSSWVAVQSGSPFLVFNEDQVTGSTAGSVRTLGGLYVAKNIISDGSITLNGGAVTGGASGLTINSGGTNQNITLTPNGTGEIHAGNLRLYPTTLAIGAVSNDVTFGTFSNFSVLFAQNGAEKMRLNTSGNLLIAETADQSNGRLQFGTHTTSAGGIGFYDFSLYRSAAGILTNNGGGMILTGASTNTLRLSTEVIGSTWVGLWANDAGSPTGANYAFASTGAVTQFNASSQIALLIASDSTKGVTFYGTYTLFGSANPVVVSNTDDSSAINNGSGAYYGGLGVTKKLNVGGKITGSGDIEAGTGFFMTGTGNAIMNANAGVPTASFQGYYIKRTDAGDNMVFGLAGATYSGIGVAGNEAFIYTGGGAFKVTTGSAQFKVDSASTYVLATTAASSSTTGALIVSGGAGIAGKLYVGDILTTVASGTGSAGLNVPHGTAPTTPTNGDVWTTTSGMYVQINGSTVGPLGTGGGGGTPGGSSTQVQYNAAGSFGGISGLTSDGTNMTAGSGNLRATSPRITTGILDTNGATMATFSATASAINYFTLTNAATAGKPKLSTGSSSDTTVQLVIQALAASGDTSTVNVLSTTGAHSKLFVDTTTSSEKISYLATGLGGSAYSFFGTNNITGGTGFVTGAGLLDTCIRVENKNFVLSTDAGSSIALKINTAGKSIFYTPTTSTASINLPHGTAPSSPSNGDVWTTTAGMYAYINGSTVGPFASGGGGTINSGTAQQLPYYSASTTLSPATGASQYFIGSAAYSSAAGGMLSLNAESTTQPYIISRYSGTSYGPGIAIQRSRGTIASPSAVQSGDTIGEIRFGGYGTSAWHEVYNKILCIATENWTNGALGSKIAFQLAVAGTVTRVDNAFEFSATGSTSSLMSALGDITITTGSSSKNLALNPTGHVTIAGATSELRVQPTSGYGVIRIYNNTTEKALIGSASATDNIVTGSLAGDWVTRTSGNILFSSDGSTVGFKIAATTPNAIFYATTAASSKTSASVVLNGGLGVAKGIYANSLNIVQGTAATDADLSMLAPTTASAYVTFHAHNDAPAISRIGAAGAANAILTGSVAGDLCLWVNNSSQGIMFGTATYPSAIGFSIEANNAGISWGRSTTGTIPVKSNMTVFPASGTATLAIKGTTGATPRLLFQANNDGPAVTDIGVAGAANAQITGSAVGDMCFRINGNGQAFLWSVDTTTIAMKIVGTTGQVTMPKNITSTSTTTGTLVVTGGVGISGAAYVGGLISGDTIELGLNTDTTLSRSSAGVLAVEGVVIPSISSTNTLTNKRITPRVTSQTSNATWAPSADNEDWFIVTAQAADATTISNPSGTPTNGQRLFMRIKDDGTSRALTWSGTQWRASTDLPLPTATTLGKTLYLAFVYNSADTKWDLIEKLDNF